jgi:hypothetical protein
VQWLGQHPWVYLAQEVPEVPNGRVMPVEHLRKRYGDYFFTSSLAWMMAIAIEEIMADRDKRAVIQKGDDCIGLWGVDMAATEEYGYQRAGCQFFAQIAHQLGIGLSVPPESDLMRPAPLYGISETKHISIKLLERRRELAGRLGQAESQLAQLNNAVAHYRGAIDDLDYMINTWTGEEVAYGADFKDMFQRPAKLIAVQPVPSE